MVPQWRIQDFPEEGAPTLGGAPTYDFAKFFQKLHEIERISTPGGGATCPSCPPLDPPLYQITRLLNNYILHSVFTARKRSFGQGIVFTPVCHSVHGGRGVGVSAQLHAGVHTLLADPPP